MSRNETEKGLHVCDGCLAGQRRCFVREKLEHARAALCQVTAQIVALEAIVNACHRKMQPGNWRLNKFMKTQVFVWAVSIFIAVSAPAQVALTSGTYTQNFNGITIALPTGWALYTRATNESLGTPAAFTTAAMGWGSTSPGFRNSAGTAGLTAASGIASQAKSSDRALGLSQGSVFGNPGGAFVFNFSTLGVSVTSLSFDALMLRVGSAPSSWSIQYGTGANPVSWTTLGTYADPEVWGSTHLSYTKAAGFGTNLDNQANVWFRIVDLSAEKGAGYDNVGIDNFSITTIPQLHKVQSEK